MDRSQPFGIDITFIFITKDQAGYAALRIYIIHIEKILLAVQSHDSQLIRISCERDPGNIAIRFYRYFQFFDIFRCYAVRMNRYFRVALSSFRIFEIVISGIQAVAVHLHGIFGHFTFIETDISQIFAVRRPGHQVRNGKFFFIYPIGNTVQHLIQFTVFSYLYFGIEIKLTNPYIVIHHISTHTSVRRVSRNHLFIFRIGQRFHIVTPYVIIVNHRFERTAVNRLCVPPNQHMMACTTDIIAVKIIKRTFTGRPGIEQSVYRITCTIGVFNDHTTVFIHCRIMLAIR